MQSIEPEALEKLRLYPWPGNIRQLRNAIERAVLLCEGEALRVQDLPPAVAGQKTASSRPPVAGAEGESRGARGESAVPFKGQMDAYEARVIAEAVDNTAGNQRAAARLLRMPYRTLMRKVKKYGIKFEE